MTLGAVSTPREASGTTFNSFFFAFMIPGSDAYRGSFSRRSVVTTAGSVTSIVSSPPSTSRVTFAFLFSAVNSTFDANVACGHPSTAARICPTWLLSSSTDCFPISTRSAFSSAATFASTFATASESRSVPASTSTARSAPIASAVRTCCSPSFGPTVTTTTSPVSFSRIRSASSTAISQNGFTTIFMLSRTIPLPSPLIFTFSSGLGTGLIATRIFTSHLPGNSTRRTS